jgi:chromosome segregation ATPase
MIQIQDRPDLREGMLVLVQLLPSGELLRIDDAVDWILELIQTYLSQGVTPDFLQQEAERVEEWRQTLTLQSQELGQQRLEIEARREQIQALEADLKRERQHLEALAKHSGNISQEP